ncbi:DUF2851 family protein [Mesonia sp. K7]|uniref:DUF2851 family protein n=1 Tax=Mesonia sp. K7 TaxID=2218606 RepID=UPI000DA79C45|nr:DUF2851 family protein [Mesonia sp. K7]PZD78066.1 DUF2851 domain-containing protein [Mesonia sp. K7]
MREDLLHFVWKYKKFDFLNLQTTDGEGLEIINIGIHNQNESGPDFQQAQIVINNIKWAGNVEMHLNSSDWFAHQHQEDDNYNNVILHVVWNDDVEVYRKDQTKIPTLEISNFISTEVIENYRELLASKNYHFINCESFFGEFSDFTLQNWLERVYLEKLEEKSVLVNQLLNQNANHWDEVLFLLLARSFGLNVNGQAFFEIAQSIGYKNIQKLNDSAQIEALFLGQANLLKDKKEDVYYQNLQKEYTYLKTKFDLPNSFTQVAFFKLRPPNFPTIRLSQLAQVYTKHKNLFREVISAKSTEEIYKLFDFSTSTYWETHYTFEKESKKSKKKINQKFIDLLVINTIVPIRFAYQKHKDVLKTDELLTFMRDLKREENTLVKKFNQLKNNLAKNALESQALIFLKKNYCDKNKCLDCQLGLQFLERA